MPELLTPGVFIQEIDFGPQPIEGVSTSTAGFVGETERGLVGTPSLVTSFSDYQRQFGGFVLNKVLPLAVRGFFDNGGKRCFVCRAVGGTAAAGVLTVSGGYDVALQAPPTLTNPATFQITLRVPTLVGLQVGGTNAVDIVATDGTSASFTGLTLLAINVPGNAITVQATSSNAATIVSSVKPTTHAVRYGTGIGTAVQFAARDPGTFSTSRLKVLLTPVYQGSATVLTSPAANQASVNPISAFTAGQKVEVSTSSLTSGRDYVTVSTIDLATNTITLSPAPTNTPLAAGVLIRVTGWQLDVFFDGNKVETITGISSNNLDPVNGIAPLVAAKSQWVRVTGAVNLAIGPVGTGDFPLFTFGQPSFFTGGVDGSAGATDIIGQDVAGNRTGLKAIEATDGISIIAAPGQIGQDVIGELIGQAERKLDRFAVFEGDGNDPNILNILKVRGNFNSKYAAMYYPWVEVLDPLTKTTIALPPAGHVIGCYARTDNLRGVFKAPANVTVLGISGFNIDVPDGEQDLLNPAGVNVLRTFDGLGHVIWGARTISAEGLWKYVPVRRLFIFLEQSIIRCTRFAVFEPNDLKLWAKLRDAVTNFLTSQWRAGALFGAKAEEAFFVKVDETTTTQDDRDNGRVNIIVGIAPVKPAEFIVFQIGQAPQSVIVSEQG